MSADLEALIRTLELRADEVRKLIAKGMRAKTAAHERSVLANARADRLDEEIARLRAAAAAPSSTPQHP